MMRVALLALVACASFGQDACEFEAVAAWNRFADTAKRYTDLRASGIRNAKERARLERQFAEVVKCECF
jgi:hypothetical protein